MSVQSVPKTLARVRFAYKGPRRAQVLSHPSGKGEGAGHLTGRVARRIATKDLWIPRS